MIFVGLKSVSCRFGRCDWGITDWFGCGYLFTESKASTMCTIIKINCICASVKNVCFVKKPNYQFNLEIKTNLFVGIVSGSPTILRQVLYVPLVLLDAYQTLIVQYLRVLTPLAWIDLTKLNRCLMLSSIMSIVSYSSMIWKSIIHETIML